MELNHILTWLVAFSCGISLVQLIRRRQRNWRRALLPTGILLLLGFGLLIDRNSAGYFAAAALLLLVIVPNLLGSLAFTLMSRKRFGLARGVCRLLAVLRPVGNELRELPQLIRAMEHLHHRRPEEALPLLVKLRDRENAGGQQTASTELSRMAELIRTRQTGDWQGFLDWLMRRWPGGGALGDPLLLDGYLQALGETGRRARMLAEFHRLVVAHRIELPAAMLQLVRLKLAAFCGETALVRQLIGKSAAALPTDVERFWTASSLQASGKPEAARPIFESLATAPDSRVQAAAHRRLENPLPPVASAAEHERLVLDEITRTSAHEARFAVLSLAGRGKPWCTWLIAGLLFAVFLTEIPGGSEDSNNLLELGAMIIPAAGEPDDWQRIVRAAFLHFGPLHLGLNMLGLLIFGPRLERAWGALPTLVTYLLTAIGSVGLAPLFMTPPEPGQQIILVGASGGVMGVIGALLAHTGCGLWLGRNRAVSRDFNLLLLIVVLQMAFDANTPNVSSTCHLLGLGIGIACGVIWNLLRLTLFHVPLTDSGPEASVVN